MSVIEAEVTAVAHEMRKLVSEIPEPAVVIAGDPDRRGKIAEAARSAAEAFGQVVHPAGLSRR